jgi:hypothetical protein
MSLSQPSMLIHFSDWKESPPHEATQLLDIFQIEGEFASCQEMISDSGNLRP